MALDYLPPEAGRRSLAPRTDFGIEEMQASEQSGSTTRGAYSRARPRSSQSPAPSTSQGAPTPHGISAIELVTSYSDSNIRSETPPEELTPAAPSVVYANEVFQAGRPHNRKMLRTRTSSTQTIDSDGGVAQVIASGFSRMNALLRTLGNRVGESSTINAWKEPEGGAVCFK